jgi:hypothetical protein
MREARPDTLVELTGRAGQAKQHSSESTTGHAASQTGRRSASVRLESSKHPERPNTPSCPIRRPRHAQTLSSDRTRPVKQRPCPITSVTTVRLRLIHPFTYELD